MHEYRIWQVYVVVGILVVSLFFWVHLIFNYKKRRLLILTVLTIISVSIISLYFYKRNEIIRKNQICINKPIILSSYYDKMNAVLILNDNFKYSIFHEQQNIKEGSWDSYGEDCSSIILDHFGRLSFGEFELNSEIDKNKRKQLIKEHCGVLCE